MTRINCVPPKELTRQHLIAEYREMLRLPNNVRRWLGSKKPAQIPPTYRMGKGHVTFFYDKLIYLENRHREIRQEMVSRGYSINFELDTKNLPEHLYNDWQPTDEAIVINRQRIEERLLKI